MPPTSSRRHKRSMTSRMLTALGGLRKKKPVKEPSPRFKKAIPIVKSKKATKPAAPRKTPRKAPPARKSAASVTAPRMPITPPEVPKAPRAIIAFSSAANLVGAAPTTIDAGTRARTLAFRTDGLYLDGIKYKVIAEGAIGDEELAIGQAVQKEAGLTLRLSAMGRTFAVTITQDHLVALVEKLLAGRPSKIDSAEGTVIRIERQMY